MRFLELAPEIARIGKVALPHRSAAVSEPPVERHGPAVAIEDTLAGTGNETLVRTRQIDTAADEPAGLLDSEGARIVAASLDEQTRSVDRVEIQRCRAACPHHAVRAYGFLADDLCVLAKPLLDGFAECGLQLDVGDRRRLGDEMKPLLRAQRDEFSMQPREFACEFVQFLNRDRHAALPNSRRSIVAAPKQGPAPARNRPTGSRRGRVPPSAAPCRCALPWPRR